MADDKKNTGKAPSVQLYYKDLYGDIQEHPNYIVGAWIKILCKIWHAQDGGQVTKSIKNWCRVLGEDKEKVLLIFDYISKEGIGNVTKRNDKITVVNRRTQRDAKLREQNRLRQEAFREKQKSNADITPSNTTVTPMLPNPSSSTSSSSSKKIYSQTSDELRLAVYLFNFIKQRNPNYKEPNLQKWAADADKMIRLDNRPVDEIKAVITWCQKDEFWQNNILSIIKLRKQYDQLKLKMPSSKPKIIDPEVCFLDRKPGIESRIFNGKKIWVCADCLDNLRKSKCCGRWGGVSLTQIEKWILDGKRKR